MAARQEGLQIERRHWIYRHPLAVRITHWINVLCLTILLMSGLQIFNAHPALYWGTKSHFETPSVEIKAATADDIKSGAALKSGQSVAGEAAAAEPDPPPPKPGTAGGSPPQSGAPKQSAQSSGASKGSAPQSGAPKGSAQPSGAPKESAPQAGAPKGSAQPSGAPKESAQPSASDENEDDDNSGDQQPAADRGVVTIFDYAFDTTGWLGYAYGPDGSLAERGFPSWITLPGEQDLATARRWHFTFAWLLVLNGLVYLAFGLFSGHLRRELWARRGEWRKIWPSILEHIRLRFPKGDEARHYNILQKLSYLVVIFIMLPVMILAGMTMSPGLNARFPFLLTLFGGRQSARTIHFILAFGLVGFAFIHVAMVMLSGFFNNMRSMITGRYVIDSKQRDVHAKHTASP